MTVSQLLVAYFNYYPGHKCLLIFLLFVTRHTEAVTAAHPIPFLEFGYHVYKFIELKQKLRSILDMLNWVFEYLQK